MHILGIHPGNEGDDMTNQPNPGRPAEISSGPEAAAEGSMLDFYQSSFSTRGDQLKPIVGSDSKFINSGQLPDLTIGGNSPEEGIYESVMKDGTTVIRDVRRNQYTVQDNYSKFYQEGSGTDAFRRWTTNDGSQMFTRKGDEAQMHFRDTFNGQPVNAEYQFDTATGTFWRQYDHWKVRHHAGSSADTTEASSEGTLSINVVGQGDDAVTSLDFVDFQNGNKNDTANSFSYHVTSDGIEITTLDGKHRFLLAHNQLFALNPDATQGDFFTDSSGRRYGKTLVNNPEVMAALSIDENFGVTIAGLKVYVDDFGNITAQSTEGDAMTIEISADGTQTVTSNDHYVTRVTADGRMSVYGPDEKLLGFFDPITGILGNDHILFGADFSSFEGKLIDMMGMVFETAMLHSSAKAQEQANQLASNALTSANANTAFVKEHLDSGTVDARCIGALNSSLGELSTALSACLASGARENLGAIISSMGLVNSQLSAATAKLQAQKIAESMGLHDKYALAKLQKEEGTFSDPRTRATQAVQQQGLPGQPTQYGTTIPATMPSMAQTFVA
jgi:hypothetical protein